MKQLNGISIVIITKGRVKMLGDLLESVRVARNNFLFESEVILVDDSKKKDISKIEKLCIKYSARRVYHSPSIPGKRNRGAEEAKYDIILYLDSDCIASPNLLNEHYMLFTEDKVGGVAGLLEFVGENTWFWNIIDKSPYVVCFGMPKWLEKVPWTPTANCSVRKDVLNLIEGFDEKFPKFGGEDVDFGLRLTKQGFVLKCSKEALVYHAKETWSSPLVMFKKLWLYGSANYYLVDKHLDLTIEALPSKPVIGLVILFFSIIMSIITPVFLLLLPFWFFIDLFLITLMFNAIIKENKSTFIQQLILQILKFLNEMGYACKCIIKLKYVYIYKSLIYFNEEMNEIYKKNVVYTWGNMIIFGIVFGIVFIIL